MATPFNILYVCDGNTVRSPLAAAVTSSLVAGDESGLSWQISSLGTDAVGGDPVRPEVQRAASARDLDLTRHRARALTREAILDPDLVLAMSWDQVTHIWSMVPEAWGHVFTIKEFIHWSKQAPSRPPILFADRISQMRDKVQQAHMVRKRARADHGFWGGLRPQDLNLIEPHGHGDEAWETLAEATRVLVTDVITLLVAEA